MTSYTAITDPDVDPESPGNTTLFTRLRDNPLAIAEGDATAPTVDKAIGANWVKLATATASTSSSIDFTTGIDSAYDEYIITMRGMRPTIDNTGLRLRMSTDGGSTWITADYDWQYNTSGVVGAGGSDDSYTASINSHCELTSLSLNAGSTHVAQGEIHVGSPADSSIATVGRAIFVNYVHSPSALYEHESSFDYGVAASVNAVQLYMSSGNISVGEFTLYGVRSL